MEAYTVSIVILEVLYLNNIFFPYSQTIQAFSKLNTMTLIYSINLNSINFHASQRMNTEINVQALSYNIQVKIMPYHQLLNVTSWI